MQSLVKPSLNMSFIKGTCRYSNSYGYALNRPDLKWLKLGHAFSNAAGNLKNLRPVASKEYFSSLAKNDGLIEITKDDLQPKKIHALAILGYVGFDCGEPCGLYYDIFRLNKNGIWSYKSGIANEAPAQSFRKDAQLTADNLKTEYTRYILSKGHDYSTFGGYFKVPDKGLIAIHHPLTFDPDLGPNPW